MKKRCSQHRTRAARSQCVIKMLDSACPAGSDNRDSNGVRNCTRQLDIVTVACAVAIHARQKYLARSELLRTRGPFDRIKTNGPATAVCVNLPTTFLPSARVDRDDDALAAKRLSTGFDQLRIIDGRGVEC